MTEERDLQMKRLELVVAEIDRQYGAGSIMRVGANNIEPWPAISTGAYTLDKALGIGGLPLGRIVEIYGQESSGKSTLCLSVIAEAQRQGYFCAFIDTEHALDPQYARALGVNMDELYLSQPDYGEMALEIAIRLVRSGAVKVVVIDSVAALVPKAELDGDMEKEHMGLLPRLMGKAMRKLAGAAAESGTLVIFTNQIREKLGILFGNPETTPGGRALKFSASVRLELKKSADIKDREGNTIGTTVLARIPKNKMAPPLKKAEFDIVYGKGINVVGCIVDVALEAGVLVKAAAWIKYGDEILAQGRQQTIDLLASDLDLLDTIKGQLENANL